MVATELSEEFQKLLRLIPNMDDTFYAAERIPAKLSAHEVACEFIELSCENLMKAGENMLTWLVRYWVKC